MTTPGELKNNSVADYVLHVMTLLQPKRYKEDVHIMTLLQPELYTEDMWVVQATLQNHTVHSILSDQMLAGRVDTAVLLLVLGKWTAGSR